VALEVHIRIAGGIEAKYVRVHFAEVDPDALCILAFIDLLVFLLVEVDFGSVHVECKNASLLASSSVGGESYLLVTPSMILNVSAPANSLAFLFTLLLRLCIHFIIFVGSEQWLGHHVLVGFFIVLKVLIHYFLLIFDITVLGEQIRNLRHVMNLLGTTGLFLCVDHLLLLNPLTILNELVVEFIVDESVKDSRSDNEISLRHFVTHAASCHEFDNDRLGCLNPVSL